MSYYYDINQHDEDDLPDVSLPTSNYSRLHSNHDDDDEHSNSSLHNWKNLYETSVQSLRSDEDQHRLSPVKSFYLEPQTSTKSNDNHSLQDQRLESPIDEIEFESTKNKFKWDIRLPELLNTMVGPDRQKREVSRRHTTNVVFQQSSEINSSLSQNHINQPMPPLVQKLRQKYDSMSTNASSLPPTTETKNHRFHIPRYQRLTSLNSRTLTTERSTHRSRPALPIRSIPENTSTRFRSGSIGSNNSSTIINHRNKTGPPISYSKHYYPPPSTTSVVKQLIHNSATLVYDSNSQISSIKTKPLIKSTINLEQTREDLRNTNSDLTGRQLLPENQKNKKTINENAKPRRSQSVDPLPNQ